MVEAPQSNAGTGATVAKMLVAAARSGGQALGEKGSARTTKRNARYRRARRRRSKAARGKPEVSKGRGATPSALYLGAAKLASKAPGPCLGEDGAKAFSPTARAEGRSEPRSAASLVSCARAGGAEARSFPAWHRERSEQPSEYAAQKTARMWAKRGELSGMGVEENDAELSFGLFEPLPAAAVNPVGTGALHHRLREGVITRVPASDLFYGGKYREFERKLIHGGPALREAGSNGWWPRLVRGKSSDGAPMGEAEDNAPRDVGGSGAWRGHCLREASGKMLGLEGEERAAEPGGYLRGA